MSKNPNPNANKTLTELLSELGSLRSQVAGLEESVIETLNERWVSFDSILFPSLKDWCDQWLVDVLTAYSWSFGEFRLEPKLCLNLESGVPQRFTLQDHEALSSLDSKHGGSVGRLLRMSSASRELELDEHIGYGVVPFCLIERTVGFFVVRGKPGNGAFDLRNYQKLCQSAEHLLTRLRRDILAGHFESNRQLPSRVS